MKPIIYIILAALVMVTGCSKAQDDNVIPDDVPGLADLQAAYTKTLVEESQGWYVEYRPTSAATTISLLVKFFDNGTASIISDYQGYTGEQQDVRYRIGGLLKPELIFETYSVWQAVAEHIGGKFEFYISPKDDDSFTFTQINGPVNTVYTLRRAKADDSDNIRAKATTALLLKGFATNATAYFKNLNLADLAAFWELDTDKQTLRLTYEDAAGDRQSSEFTYNYIPNGIRLNTPFIKDNISIESILFGSINGSELEVVAAGNAGAGVISVSHVPAFPYKGTVDLFMRTERVLPRFFAYTLDDLATYYSPDLQPYLINLRNSISPEMLRIQLYHYNMNAAGTTPENQLYSMQLLTRNAAGANVFLPYYTALEKMDESHVVVTPLGTTNTNGTPYLTEVLAFMKIIFPTEGVTVVPAGRAGSLQKLRVISRKNSRLYFDVTVSTPAGIYVD